ncbi:MAG: FAD-dependent oxidoreductase [Promethearchaeota archaeon]
MKFFDVIVCGAGVAGCSFAHHVSKQGFNVLLLDQKPRENLGHDWWDAVNQVVFEETEINPPQPPERLNYGSSVYTSPNGKTQMYGTTPRKYSVDRKLFAQRLLKLAIEGGTKFRDRIKILKPEIKETGVIGVIIQNENNIEMNIKARLVVDATGVRATLRRQIPFETDFEKKIRKQDTFVLYREIREAITSRTDRIVRFGHHQGLSWISFRQKGLVDILAGTLDLPNHINPKDIVKGYLQDYKGEIGEKIIRAGYGGIIPIRRCLDSFIEDGFLVIGDSASQINPIDGSGIAASMYAAYYASNTVVQALKQKMVLTKETLWPYNYNYKTIVGSKFVALDIVRLFLMGRNDPEKDLNYLFGRGIVGARDLQGWGQKSSSFSTFKRLIKGLDQLPLLRELKRVKKLSKKATETYRAFPEQFSQESFEKWQNDLKDIFQQIPLERSDIITTW